MILYNVTVSIDPNVHQDWLEWMRRTHIPDVMETGCFIESRISRVHGEEEGGMTFAISYVAKTQEHFDRYQNDHAAKLQEEHTIKFSGKFAATKLL